MNWRKSKWTKSGICVGGRVWTFVDVDTDFSLFRIQELTSARQSDRQTMQQTDRKLIEERRQRQSLDTQLNNERKQRKMAEEKLSRYVFSSVHWLSGIIL